MKTDPCTVCDQVVKDGFKDDQDCENCNSYIAPGNHLVWDLIRQASYGLFDGLGGVHLDTIDYIFDRNNIPHYDRDDLYEKFLVYIEVMKAKSDG